jgi:hypothetical protein
MDVSDLGYLAAGRNLIGVVLVALLLASVFVGIDRLLSRPVRRLARAETGP